MIHNLKIFLFIITLSTLVSCSKEPPILHEKTEFDPNGWNRFKVLKYTPEIIDNSVPYIVSLKLEFTDDYEFNYFKIQFSKESDGESYVKIFTLPIKDSKGIFLEKPKDGVYTVNAILSRQIYFSSPGKYIIEIEHLMSQYNTKGIKSAEFTIEKHPL